MEYRTRKFVFQKALKHGVLIDFQQFENDFEKLLDVGSFPSIPYRMPLPQITRHRLVCTQYPFLLAFIAAFLATIVIFMDPFLPTLTKFTTLVLVLNSMNEGLLRPFHEVRCARGEGGARSRS